MSIFLSWIEQQDLAVVIYIKIIYSYLHSESDARSKLWNLSLIALPYGIEVL